MVSAGPAQPRRSPTAAPGRDPGPARLAGGWAPAAPLGRRGVRGRTGRGLTRPAAPRSAPSRVAAPRVVGQLDPAGVESSGGRIAPVTVCAFLVWGVRKSLDPPRLGDPSYSG